MVFTFELLGRTWHQKRRDGQPERVREEKENEGKRERKRERKNLEEEKTAVAVLAHDCVPKASAHTLRPTPLFK